MTISSSTFVEDTILFIRDLLRDTIDDPLGRTNGFIMTSYPKRLIQYPVITIKQVNVDTVKLGMQSTVLLANLSLEIRVWARNAKEGDDLLGKVIDELRSSQYNSEGTVQFQIHDFIINSVNYLVDVDGDNSVHSKILNISYKIILN
jgi:hypothetical protein